MPGAHKAQPSGSKVPPPNHHMYYLKAATGATTNISHMLNGHEPYIYIYGLNVSSKLQGISSGPLVWALKILKRALNYGPQF